MTQKNLVSKEVTSFFHIKPLNNENTAEYHARLSERRKREEQKRSEERFLRSSLRQSERLRSLARAKRIVKELSFGQQIKENAAFEDDSMSGSIENFTLDVPGFLKQLRNTIERRKRSQHPGEKSESPGLSDAEWDWLANTVSGKSVLQAFNLHDTIARALETCRNMQVNTPKEQWPICETAVSVLDSVVNYINAAKLPLPQNEWSDLMNTFSNPNFRALLSAHDGLAGVWIQESDEAARRKDSVGSTSEGSQINRPTAYVSPVEGCYKILATDDQGDVLSPIDGTVLVNVILHKTSNEYLGATVRAEGSALVIGRILSGGLVERCGLLNEGDELLSVNGIDLTGKDVDFVINTLLSLSGRIVLLVAPAFPITDSLHYIDETIAHLRALFSYGPSNDLYNPCREASLEFDKGDILRIISTRDPNWWQALRIDEIGAVGVSGSLAGLIPSPFFQRQRSLLRLEKFRNTADDDEYESEISDEETECDVTGSMLKSSLSLWVSGAANSTYASRMSGMEESSEQQRSLTNSTASDPVWSLHGYGPKQILRRQRGHRSTKVKLKNIISLSSLRGKSPSHASRKEYYPSLLPANLATDDEDQLKWLEEENVKGGVRRPSLLTYEPVDLYFPQPQRRRPLVFVGPVHVGRQRLIERLIESDPKRFAFPYIHTTNEKMTSTPLQHYEVISKPEFQQLQKDHAFIEWGVFNRNYYGTKHESVEKLVRAGNVCVIALRPDSIRTIRRTPFLPCIIFVSPPDSLEKLAVLRKNLGDTSRCSDDELNACIDQSKKMELHYGHFFDFILVPKDLDSGLQELRKIALEVERNPQWVPVHWIQLATLVAVAEANRASANEE